MSVTAKIATVISQYELALTAGAEDGVQVGDIATMYDVIDVTDPDDETVLGQIKRPALRLQISEVQARISVGTAYEIARPRTDSDLAAIFSMDAPSRVQITTSLSETDFRTVYVKVGDEVEIEPTDRADEEAS